MDYVLLKTIHITTVTLSGASFFARGLGIVANASWVRARPARILPHINDTVLLVSAVLLAWSLGITPFNSPWLGAKIAGLLIYILLGTVAIRPGHGRAVRLSAWLLALSVFGYIVSVALIHHPAGFMKPLLGS